MAAGQAEADPGRPQPRHQMEDSNDDAGNTRGGDEGARQDASTPRYIRLLSASVARWARSLGPTGKRNIEPCSKHIAPIAASTKAAPPSSVSIDVACGSASRPRTICSNSCSRPRPTSATGWPHSTAACQGCGRRARALTPSAPPAKSICKLADRLTRRRRAHARCSTTPPP